MLRARALSLCFRQRLFQKPNASALGAAHLPHIKWRDPPVPHRRPGRQKPSPGGPWRRSVTRPGPCISAPAAIAATPPRRRSTTRTPFPRITLTSPLQVNHLYKQLLLNNSASISNRGK